MKKKKKTQKIPKTISANKRFDSFHHVHGLKKKCIGNT